MLPELRVLSLKIILQNITEYTPLSKLNSRDLGEVCEALPLDLPLSTALALPLDDSYWKRRTLAHYPPPNLRLKIRQQNQRKRTVRDRGDGDSEGKDDSKGEMDGGETPGGGSRVGSSASKRHTPTKTASSNPYAALAAGLPPINVIRCEDQWQRAYLEAHLAQAISATSDNKRGWRLLAPLLKLCEPHVTYLHLCTLAPATPSKEARRNSANEEQGSLEHLNMYDVLTALSNLEGLSVRYQTVLDGGELCWGDHGISVQDASFLSTAVLSSKITRLSVYESCLDDDRADVLLRNLKSHKILKELDLQSNFISCAAVPILCDLIASTSLESLCLLHNKIGKKGAKLLGEALAEAPPLRALAIDLNPLLSEGGVAILDGAAKGGQLHVLSMAGCRLMDECWHYVAQALTSVPLLQYICLASNPFQEKPPESVVLAANNVSKRGRVLLTNLDGKTYLLGHVEEGRTLPSPLLNLRNNLATPLTPEAADEDIQHYLPLHGIYLNPEDFMIEEELEGLCLFSKNLNPGQ
ncbi:dynein regulatory complex subunit 5 [Macrobrachium rosenbergii]|uniref:dynein regulatory complex subunit 5 n=1 Tax=Macrobrachium rosenbergii TaxID=79674 RepID=UPI0034D54F4C